MMKIASAPPALTSPPSRPERPSLPGIGGAAAVIAGYFALQLVISNLLAAVLGFVVGMQHSGNAKASSAALSVLLGQADVRTGLIITTLLLAMSACLWLIRRRWPQAWSCRNGQGLGFAPAPPARYAGGLLLGLALPLLGSVLTQWLAHGQAVSQDVKQLGADSTAPLRLLLAIVVVGMGPLIEEVLFRGVLLCALRQRFGDAISVALSAALFALVHLPDLAFEWYALPNLALLGLALGWLRIVSRSLWPAVTAHSTNNLLAIVSWFTPDAV